MYSIEARGLVKTYPVPGKPSGGAPGRAKGARLRALDGLDLAVPAGAIFALVGPNGAGKTTTVKILTSLATPDEGTVSIEGIDVLDAEGEPGQLKQELKGDVVHVELAPGADRELAGKTLSGIPVIRDVYVAGGSVSARGDDGAAAVPVILARLAGAGIAVKSVAVAQPSLDEVYLRYAGRRYTEVNL